MKENVFVRMSYDVYKDFERQVGAMGVNKDSTVIEVSYQLGIQSVLKKLREGYVTGEPVNVIDEVK